jgi:hypothetical protein
MRLPPLVLRSFHPFIVALGVALAAGLRAGPPALAQVPMAGAVPAAESAHTLRIGIVHPQPHLCRGQEPAQRDLRVLRLAFGLQRTLAQRLDWPWYLVPVTPGARDLALDTQQLWSQPWPTMIGTPGHPGWIASWQNAVVANIPGVELPPPATGAALRVDDPHPLLASRFAGHEWTPDYAEATPGAEPFCRHWPTGVEFKPGSGRETYTLRRQRSARGAAFVLIGYRQSGSLWADYAGGRLDAALIEGSDLGGDAVIGGQVWGMEVGTQQLVLRFHPTVAKSLPAESRELLSQAINRTELAQLAPRGMFRPARAFAESLMASRNIPETELFQWDSRVSRQLWLEKPHDVPRLRVGALNQPFLESVAQRLAGQWQKSLELPAVPQSFEVDQLWRDWNRGAAELMLDVVDLDDGSLQDLWSESLGSALRAKDAGPDTWEAQLRKTLPYLPLLTHVNWVVSNSGAGVITQLCPGCVIGGAP